MLHAQVLRGSLNHSRENTNRKRAVAGIKRCFICSRDIDTNHPDEEFVTEIFGRVRCESLTLCLTTIESDAVCEELC